jgi:hypothetical protein
MIVGESPRVYPNYAGLRTCPHELRDDGSLGCEPWWFASGGIPEHWQREVRFG